MPCSVAVYEKSDGYTYVAAMNLQLMSRLFDGEIADTLSAVAKEDRSILSFISR
jgi:uncharacterized protein (DUF302 family)